MQWTTKLKGEINLEYVFTQQGANILMMGYANMLTMG